MRIFGKKKTEPGTAQAPSERDTQTVQRTAHTEPVAEPEAPQGPLEDRREGGRRDSYTVEPDPVPVRDEAPVDDHRPSADTQTPVRGKALPSLDDVSDLNFGAAPAAGVHAVDAMNADDAPAGQYNGPEDDLSDMDGENPAVAAKMPWDDDAEPLPEDAPEDMESAPDEEGIEPAPVVSDPPGSIAARNPSDFPGFDDLWPAPGDAGHMDGASGLPSVPDDTPDHVGAADGDGMDYNPAADAIGKDAPKARDDALVADAPAVALEPVSAAPPVRFEPVVDTEPVPPDLTFSSLSSIMNTTGDVVWVSLMDDPGVGVQYALADALLKYGNCRVVKVDTAVANGETQLVYRIMLRDEPVSKRLRDNAFPLPYDVPCWRIGNKAVLYMSLPANGNGAAPCHEAVDCRIIDAIRGEDRTTVTVMTRDGATIEGIPIDRLFLPGISPDEKPDLSDDQLCEKLADGMPD